MQKFRLAGAKSLQGQAGSGGRPLSPVEESQVCKVMMNGSMAFNLGRLGNFY